MKILAIDTRAAVWPKNRDERTALVDDLPLSVALGVRARFAAQSLLRRPHQVILSNEVLDETMSHTMEGDYPQHGDPRTEIHRAIGGHFAKIGYSREISV